MKKELKADLIARIITSYEEGVEQILKGLSYKEYQAAHTEMLAKIYDAQWQLEQKQVPVIADEQVNYYEDKIEMLQRILAERDKELESLQQSAQQYKGAWVVLKDDNLLHDILQEELKGLSYKEHQTVISCVKRIVLLYNEKAALQQKQVPTDAIKTVVEYIALNYGKPIISEDKQTIMWNCDDAEALYTTDEVIEHCLEESALQQKQVLDVTDESHAPIHGYKIDLPISGNFLNWINRTAGYYGHPVYLVGSQITGSKTPRDVDIVCAIPDKEFELRFGNVDDWMQEGGTGLWTDVRWKWASRCAKDSLDGMKETKLQIDFKVQPMALFNRYSYVHKAFLPVRLDTGKFDYDESALQQSSVVDELEERYYKELFEDLITILVERRNKYVLQGVHEWKIEGFNLALSIVKENKLRNITRY